MDDGRQIGYCVLGHGKPVVYFHGTASSRLEVLLFEKLTQEFDLRLISIDRPGYGLSTFKSGKSLEDFNDDVNALSNHLGIDRFAVIGWSGGGAFALAYLASFPQRVSRAVIAGAPALPFDVTTAHNVPFARFAMKIPFLGGFAVRRMRNSILGTRGNVDAFFRSSQGRQFLHGCSQTDLKFLSNPVRMAHIYESMTEAFRQRDQGVKAVLQEHQAFMKPWTFSFSKITVGKLTIWHGSEDKTCRVSNAKLNAKNVRGSKLKIFEGQGHFSIFENLTELGEILRSED